MSILLTALVALLINDGHTLTALWNKYQEAKKADKPQTEAKILQQIKDEASAKRLSVDFYDAATLYVEAVSRRNWKQREPARKALEQEIMDYSDPMVTFVWMDMYNHCSLEELIGFSQKSTFQGRTEPMFRGVDVFLAGALPHFITDNAEYVLWRLAARGDKASAKALEGKPYPLDAAIEYFLLPTEKAQRTAALKALADKYDGTAAGLIPQADLLQAEFGDLNEKRPSTDTPYKELYRKAKDFEKRRAAFTKDEKIIAEKVTGVKYLIQNLENYFCETAISGTDILVIFHNLKSTTVTLTPSGSKKALKIWKLQNTAASFYKPDTLKVAIPELSDGNYDIVTENGFTTYYRQYTLSIASRRDSRGPCVYVADYKTGEALKSAKVFLKKGSSVVASTTMTLDGFTPLPSSITKRIDTKSSYQLVAESGKRRSESVWLDTSEETYGSETTEGCNIYRDRGAYNPGDILKYKTVLYSGDRMKELKVTEGKKLTVILRDCEGNEIGKQNVKTSKYGSASGEFTIPEGLRNGWFSLAIKDGKRTLSSDTFRVDEFVLPSFEISIDKREGLYLKGDDVPVSGTVTFYSGHSAANARAEISVRRNVRTVCEESIIIGTDSRFSFIVPKVQEGWHDVTVKIIDPTGETIEKSTGFYISEHISIGISVDNKADGEFSLADEPSRYYWKPRRQNAIVTEDVLRLTLTAMDDGGNKVPLQVSYAIEGIGKGTASSGESVEIPLAGIPAGVYTIKADAHAGDGAKGETELRFLLLRPSDKAVPEGVKSVFLPGSETVSGKIGARFGYGPRSAHAVLTLFGDKGQVLLTKRLTAKGMADVSLDYKASYPDAVRLQLFWFADGGSFNLDRQYRREKTKFTLPLRFTRFTDKAYPGTEYTFTLKTAADVEALAAIWDKSIDAISPNWWPQVSMADFSVPSVSVSTSCGAVTEGMLDGVVTIGYGTKRGVLMSSKSAAPAMMNMAVEEAAVMDDSAEAGAASSGEDPIIRSKFENALTFQPHLVSAVDGTLSFSFHTSDKLSTYYVRVYAHTRDMKNAVAEEQLTVSLPVKVSILEPRYLYEGDSWNAAVSVSSIADVPVSGTVRIDVNGSIQSRRIMVPAGETMTASFPVEALAEGALTVTASFIADEFSDAVRVSVPVLRARQSLTESHSAVLLEGESREKLLAELRSRFVNVPGSSAALKEISVLDMVKDAIPSHIEPSGKDVISLTEAFYVRAIAAQLLSVIPGSDRESHPDLLPQILSCRNSDGGFAWFEGMNSSPVITAVVLERFALLKERGVEVPDVTSSVKFLDRNQFGAVRPYWCGSLSDAQYMHVRALYPEVPLEVKPVSSADKKRMAEFKKYAKNYLTPSSKRGLEGQIIAKARRLLTLRNLAASKEGIGLARAWGVGLTAGAKLQKSIRADVVSLLEYAVRHRDGGWYYPNAVMPWRGLLESEAYAHALLCNLLQAEASDIADGIRLWLMLQKETQKWDTDPAFVDAIDAILKGSDAVLDTRVLALSASYDAAFDDIRATGNGFTLERRFMRDGSVIKDGDPVYVGEKISAQYIIWNAENRSYVKLSAPREAALQPVNQLSGRGGLGIFTGSTRLEGMYGFYNWNIYRNVKTDRTEYYWEACPEESTTLTEEFYVTRSGAFSAPVPVIESLYAPHYRANAPANPTLTVR